VQTVDSQTKLNYHIKTIKINKKQTNPCCQARAAELIPKIEVRPDISSGRVANLRLSGKIKAGARTIFGFGDAHGLHTMSANLGFVRAAASQGVRSV
jgi:hypothetical protein